MRTRRFIEKENTVQVQIAIMEKNLRRGTQQHRIMADFEILKSDFEEFLEHVIHECKRALERDELFPK